MKKVLLTKVELKLITRALKEAQLYTLNKAEEQGKPQSANKYITELNKIYINLQEA